ncbi:MAG: TIGR02710 family CRISPR-associated CARF protein, partial [Sphaerospermopsis kisseleviana]
PIITAIRELQPDRVVFLCSDGPKGSKSQVVGSGTPCEVRRGTEVIEKLPNIPTQIGLGDKFQPDRDVILIEDPDNLSECYVKASLYIQNLQETVADAQMMADYTGGTKSMSVGLAMASVDYQLKLHVTTAVRTNIIKVERGELTGQATVAPVVVQRTLEQFLPIFLEQYNHPSAIAQLRRLSSSMEMQPEVRRQIQTLCAFCLGLDAWDRFEHRDALELLEPQMKNPVIRNLVLFLKRVINSRGQIDE